MLLKPAMNVLLKEIPSRYMLVNVAAHRAREIADEAEEEGVSLTEKPVTMALAEVAAGKLTMQEEETEEVAQEEE